MSYQHRNESVSIGTTPIQINELVGEKNCEVIAIKNTSASGQIVSLSIGIGTTATAGQGIVLNPSESWVESTDSSFNPTFEPISAVSDNAGATISFYQRLRR